MAIDLDFVSMKQMPDGLEHICYDTIDLGDVVNINAKIRNSNDLIKLGMLKNILDQDCYTVNLNLRYLSAGRMDRAIANDQPNTLKVYCDMINAMCFNRVFVDCPHSDLTIARLDDAFETSYDVYFYQQRINRYYLKHPEEISIVLPDSGFAKKWYNRYAQHIHENHNIVECSKQRDMQTGKLSGFSIVNGNVTEKCIMLDDLCDGGGTFAGIAELLKKNGAKHVELVVFHGIFSKSLPIPNIDFVVSTTSYLNLTEGYDFSNKYQKTVHLY